MGGPVAITLRTRGGREYRASGWTNATPWMFNNPLFFADDPEHVGALVKNFEAALKSPKAERGWYERHNHLAPYGYGLIVADLKTRTLLGRQGYTAFGTTGTVFLWDENPHTPKPGGALDRLLGFVRRGWVSEVRKVRGREKDGRWRWVRDTGAWDEARVRSVAGRPLAAGEARTFHYAPAGWKVRNYDEGATGFVRMREDVKALGFKLTPYENRLWREYLTRLDGE